MNLIFLMALIILISVWVEELNYRHVHRKVATRWENGDKTCRAGKCWYGWRVVEYAEEADL